MPHRPFYRRFSLTATSKGSPSDATLRCDRDGYGAGASHLTASHTASGALGHSLTVTGSSSSTNNSSNSVNSTECQQQPWNLPPRVRRRSSLRELLGSLRQQRRLPPPPPPRVRLCDFGLARLLRDGEITMSTPMGTIAYSAPEIRRASGPPGSPPSYTSAVDCWSIGVVAYALLSGHHPFDPAGDATDTQLSAAVASAHYDFSGPAWAGISEQAQDLIRRLLVLEPSQRLTTAQILQHPWISPALPPSLLQLPVPTSHENSRALSSSGSTLSSSSSSSQLQAASAVDSPATVLQQQLAQSSSGSAISSSGVAVIVNGEEERQEAVGYDR